MPTFLAALAYAILTTVWVATGRPATAPNLLIAAWLAAGFAFAAAAARAELRRIRIIRLTMTKGIDQSTTPPGNDQLL